MGCCDSISIILRAFVRYLKARTYFELLMSLFCWLLLIFGSAGRFVFLDKFRRYVPQPSPDPFALEIMSDTFVFGFFLVVFIVFAIASRPDLAYLSHRRGVACTVIAGTGFAASYYLQHYAASHVDPALRHISALVLVLFTLLCGKFMSTGPGQGQWSAWHVFPFAFCIGGVILAGAGSLKDLPATMKTSDDQAWFSIYLVSYIPEAVALVAVTYYFKRYIIFREQDPRRERANAAASSSAGAGGAADAAASGDFVTILARDSIGPAEDDNDDRFDFRAQKRTDPLTGRIVFALFLTLGQLIVTLLLGPTDIAPFFGSSANVTDGLDRVRDTFTCVFDSSSAIARQPILSAQCERSWRPFLELTCSSVAQVAGLMFTLQRTPFGTAQAMVLGITSLSSLLRSTWPEELDDPGAKVGNTNLGESFGAVALSTFAVILTFIVEEHVRLESAPRRSALNENAGTGNNDASERSALVNEYGVGGAGNNTGRKKKRSAKDTSSGGGEESGYSYGGTY